MKVELNIKRDVVKKTAEWAALLAKTTIVGCGVGFMEAMVFPKHWKAMHLPLIITAAMLTMTPRDCAALCLDVDDAVDFIFDKIEKN